MGRFDGQVVWITGGGTGIGLACAVEFARQGGRVAVSGRRVDKLANAVAAIEATGAEAAAVACDVTDPEACERAVAEILERWGRLDVCVANAGYAAAGYVGKMPLSQWRAQYETNVFGVLHTLYAALDELKKNRGRAVIVSSVAGYVSAPKIGAYASTKHAVRAIGSTMALELRKFGASCTVVCPGYVKSDIARVDNSGQLDPTRSGEQSPMAVPADRAARQIVAATAKRKVVAGITGHGRVLILLERWFPGLVRLLVARFV